LPHSESARKNRSTTREYQVFWNNLIAASSLKDALKIVLSILADLKKLVEWEREGKIRGECVDCSPDGRQGIEVLDESIEPQLRKVSLVSCLEHDEEEKVEAGEEEKG
jgi:hypothetical protein